MTERMYNATEMAGMMLAAFFEGQCKVRPAFEVDGVLIQMGPLPEENDEVAFLKFTLTGKIAVEVIFDNCDAAEEDDYCERHDVMDMPMRPGLALIADLIRRNLFFAE